MDLIFGYVMDFARWVLIVVLSALYPGVYSPWVGKVVEIVRADEIKVEKQGKPYTVRLYGIDAPISYPGASDLGGNTASGERESRNEETIVGSPSPPQAYGKIAKEYITQRALGKAVRIQPLPGEVSGPWYRPKIWPYDRYNRVQAFVWIHGEEGESLNEEMLRKGLAWWYSPFVPFERGFKYLEDNARIAKIGIWEQPHASPPWQWQGTNLRDGNPMRERRAIAFWIAGVTAILALLGIVTALMWRLIRRIIPRKNLGFSRGS